jgi:hypothetical protein
LHRGYGLFTSVYIFVDWSYVTVIFVSIVSCKNDVQCFYYILRLISLFVKMGLLLKLKRTIGDENLSVAQVYRCLSGSNIDCWCLSVLETSRGHTAEICYLFFVTSGNDSSVQH